MKTAKVRLQEHEIIFGKAVAQPQLLNQAQAVISAYGNRCHLGSNDDVRVMAASSFLGVSQCKRPAGGQTLYLQCCDWLEPPLRWKFGLPPKTRIH